MKDKKYFCYEIYKNLSIWSHNGSIGYNPCSFYKGYIKTDDKLDIAGVWNGPEHQALKHAIETDTPIPGCASCYHAEEHGLKSRRQGAAERYEQYHKDTTIELAGPQGIDYSVGNLCNLKCVICSPHSSSQWIPDYQKLYPLKDITEYKYDKFNQLEITDVDALKDVKSIHFHGGGEPFLTDNHLHLLQRIDAAQGLSKVRVYYNTNGTKTVSKEVLSMWEKCELVEIYFSIDDLGESFNYQRTGASWNEVDHNLTWFWKNAPHNTLFNVNCTWSYLNLYNLKSLIKWQEFSFPSNRFGDPVNLVFQKAIGPTSIDHVSETLYTELMNKFDLYPTLQDLVKTLTISDKPHTEFLNYIQKLDAIRGTSFQNTASTWAKLLV